MEYDPKSNLRHWPFSMARFGQNPYSENLYRIVFAPTRLYLVVGERAHWWPKYPECGNSWILERWRSAMEYHGSKESWDLLCSNLGPYPSRGEYDIAHHFEIVQPDDCNLDKLIAWMEEGHKRNPRENTVALKAALEKDEADLSLTRQAMIRNAMPAFGARPISGLGGGRGTKTYPIQKSANELGLPLLPAPKKRNQDLSRSSLVSLA